MLPCKCGQPVSVYYTGMYRRPYAPVAWIEHTDRTRCAGTDGFSVAFPPGDVKRVEALRERWRVTRAAEASNDDANG